MPDVINQNNGGSRASGSAQPFTLTRHKKVEIPTTSVLGHPAAQNRREPADLGIPYPAGLSAYAFPRASFKLFLLVQGDMESNVLRKVASLTYDMAMDQKHQASRARPQPERQDLSMSDKFEGMSTACENKDQQKVTSCLGNMLVSNLLSSIDEDHYLRLLISNNDLRLLMSHFVNYLLNIGIICPLEDAAHCDKFTVKISQFKIQLKFSHRVLINRWIECINGDV